MPPTTASSSSYESRLISRSISISCCSTKGPFASSSCAGWARRESAAVNWITDSSALRISGGKPSEPSTENATTAAASRWMAAHVSDGRDIELVGTDEKLEGLTVHLGILEGEPTTGDGR